MNWLFFSLLTLILWGVWGIFVKLSLNYVDWKTYWIVSYLPYLMMSTLLFLFYKPALDFRNEGVKYALIAGLIGTISYIFFFQAMKGGKVSLTITLTALYPLITIILAFLVLKESVNLFQGIGLILALISIVLLSIS